MAMAFPGVLFETQFLVEPKPPGRRYAHADLLYAAFLPGRVVHLQCEQGLAPQIFLSLPAFRMPVGDEPEQFGPYCDDDGPGHAFSLQLVFLEFAVKA